MTKPGDPAVADWLASIGLDEYAPAFAVHRISLDTLPYLSDADLKECGITAVGDRRRLQIEIQKLLALPPPAAVAPPVPAGIVHLAAPAAAILPEAAAVVPAEAAAVPVQQVAPPLASGPLPEHAEVCSFREFSERQRRRLERLVQAQRARSLVASIVIALLSVLLIGLMLALILIRPLFEEVAPIVAYSSTSEKEAPVETRKVSTRIQREPSARSSSLAKVIAANTVSPLAVPVPDIDPRVHSLDFGSGDDFGDGWGDGGDGGGGFGSIPATMRRRCSQEDRLQRLAQTGGTAQCEDAVVRGLDWLQRTQGPDGGWDGGRRSAMTGLALLAFLGHCETPLSERYGDTVLRGLVFLVNLGASNNGKLIPKGGEQDKQWPYEHAIATYALAEATTFCKQLGVSVPGLNEVTQRAGQFIIDNQHKSGGWDYSYAESGDRGGDLSVTAWHIQALKAANHTGLDFRNMSRCISEAMEYVRSRSDRSGGFGYTGKEAGGNAGYHTLTGAGMLSMQMWGHDSATQVRKGAEYVVNHSRFDYNSEFCDLYGHYYEGQAMLNRGGEQWKKYNAMFRDQVLNNQNPDGSWKTPGGGRNPRAVGAEFVGNVHYRTCLCILMLEVYYRFLPGTGGG